MRLSLPVSRTAERKPAGIFRFSPRPARPPYYGAGIGRGAWGFGNMAACFVSWRAQRLVARSAAAPLRLSLAFCLTVPCSETSEERPIPETTCDAIVASVGASVVARVLLGREHEAHGLRLAHPAWNGALMSPDVNLTCQHEPKREAHQEEHESEMERGDRPGIRSVTNEKSSDEKWSCAEGVRTHAFAEPMGQDRSGGAVVLAEGSDEAWT